MDVEVLAMAELELNDWPLSRHETITRGIMRNPELHIGTVRCIPNIERIPQDNASIVKLT